MTSRSEITRLVLLTGLHQSMKDICHDDAFPREDTLEAFAFTATCLRAHLLANATLEEPRDSAAPTKTSLLKDKSSFKGMKDKIGSFRPSFIKGSSSSLSYYSKKKSRKLETLEKQQQHHAALVIQRHLRHVCHWRSVKSALARERAKVKHETQETIAAIFMQHWFRRFRLQRQRLEAHRVLNRLMALDDESQDNNLLLGPVAQYQANVDRRHRIGAIEKDLATIAKALQHLDAPLVAVRKYQARLQQASSSRPSTTLTPELLIQTQRELKRVVGQAEQVEQLLWAKKQDSSFSKKHSSADKDPHSLRSMLANLRHKQVQLQTSVVKYRQEKRQLVKEKVAARRIQRAFRHSRSASNTIQLLKNIVVQATVGLGEIEALEEEDETVKGSLNHESPSSPASRLALDIQSTGAHMA